ncbi:3-oxoacyl-ACP synthase III family protein [Streptomyces sp. ISL-11]|uniref:3-oxoacyl-ACP synthase III family protein n=1 Tax=Streptomyces sp. ISL-11 TaxID=2819174 RepID=UPI001BE7DAA0|nr:3-oxoacyl-[acyl-carrier-protein] synthase III C-terminal domain-containing protein [Streptomyces sp. ISL-11]MBT2383311.1 ketoacyl-ACP synthase III [Streptomyces sp. ISL-11]
MTNVRARLAGVAAHLPERWVSMAEREAQVAAASAPFSPPGGLVTELTGVEGVHLVGARQQASDLAVCAARKVLADSGVQAADVELMIFAASSQDMIEPATSHIVAAKLGLSCPVFDVKNACNSVLNAVEVTEALIASGRYRTVLITCGEAPSLSARLSVPNPAAFARAFPSYGFSDAGAAMLWTAGESFPSAPGVLGSRFIADSSAWQAATLRGGGTFSVREPDEEHSYFQMDGMGLRDSLRALAPSLHSLLDELGLTLTDCAFIGVHQVSLEDVDAMCALDLGIPRDRLVLTLPRHGNVASASLPLQLTRALESGQAGPGDLVALIGLAAGSSAGLVVIRL